MHEPFQQRTFKPVAEGNWESSDNLTFSIFSIYLCRAGIRALLGHKLNNTRECILSIYTKRPRTAVREITILLDKHRMRWKVKSKGKFKDIPHGAATFLRENFPSINTSSWLRKEKTFFIRAKEGKKL